MDYILELGRLVAEAPTEKLTLLLAFAALGVAALAVYSIASVTKNRDR